MYGVKQPSEAAIAASQEKPNIQRIRMREERKGELAAEETRPSFYKGEEPEHVTVGKFMFEVDSLDDEDEEEDVANEDTEQTSQKEPEENEVPVDSVLNRLCQAVCGYQGENSGIYAEDVEVAYDSKQLSRVSIIGDGKMLLPTRRVYHNGKTVEWDSVNEVRIPCGEVVELDLGVRFVLPDHYQLELTGVEGMREKYGFEVIGSAVRINRQTAMHTVVLQLHACDDLAYVQKYKQIIQARVVAA